MKKLSKRIRDIGVSQIIFFLVVGLAVLIVGGAIIDRLFFTITNNEPKEAVVTVTGKYLKGYNNNTPMLELNWTDEETGELCGMLKDVDKQTFAIIHEGDKFQAKVILHTIDSLLCPPEIYYTVELETRLP